MLTWTLPNLLPDFSDALKYVHAFLMPPINYHSIQIRLRNMRQNNNVCIYHPIIFMDPYMAIFLYGYNLPASSLCKMNILLINQ